MPARDGVRIAEEPRPGPESHRLDPLLAPGSVALVGASARADTPGNTMLRTVRADGYAGHVWGVNPKLDMAEGIACYPDLGSLPGRAEHVVIALGDAGVEAALRQAIDHGARAATVFTGGDRTDAGDPAHLARLAAMAREAGMLLCGPNTMGFINQRIGLRVTGFPSTVPMRSGGAVLITQSGSAFSALAYNDTRLKYSLCVSTGRELTVTAEDYLDWALSQPGVRAVGMFLETARAPDRLADALARADRQDVAVVALKVGRTAMSAAFAASHSGAVAGDDAAWEGLFRRHGVIRVDTLDQFAATLLACSTLPAPPAGALAALHDSGGEREMVVDIAAREGVAYAEIAPATRARIAAHLDSGLRAENPLDVWGSGHDFGTHVEACASAFLDDPAVAMTVLFQDVRENSWIASGFTGAMLRAARGSKKPVAVVTNYSAVNHRALALEVTEAGVPVIDGTEEGLRAVRALFGRRDRASRGVTPPPAVSPDIVARWRRRLSRGPALDEDEALALVADWGLATPRRATAASAEETSAAGERLGFPLALKSAAPGLAHKSDAGGVVLGIDEPAALASAYSEMAARLGPKVLLAQMVGAGVEIGFGMVRDPSFGPVVVVAAGGVWIEALADRATGLAPLAREDAEAMIGELRVARLLAGGRGRPPADRAALVDALWHFSRLAADLGDLIAEMDVNPVIVTATGAVAVDALVMPAADTARNAQHGS